MLTKEQKADDFLLSLWAGINARDCHDGYEAVMRQYLVSEGKAKSMVHCALERRHINPHHSKTLIDTWKCYHKRMLKAGDIA